MKTNTLNKRVLLLLAGLVLLTAVLAALHLTTRTAVPKGTLLVEAQGKTVEAALSELTLSPVRGTVVNGKGEETAIHRQGLLLSELLAHCGVTDFRQVTVTADDAYSAAVTREEILAPDKVYLVMEEDAVQMVVFGDPNSKRRVSGVVSLCVA